LFDVWLNVRKDTTRVYQSLTRGNAFGCETLFAHVIGERPARVAAADPFQDRRIKQPKRTLAADIRKRKPTALLCPQTGNRQVERRPTARTRQDGLQGYAEYYTRCPIVVAAVRHRIEV
jgi:hypothetical protein